MKRITALTTVLAMMLSATSFALFQPELEQRIEQVILHQPREGEAYSLKAQIELLGQPAAAREILLQMLTKYEHSQPGATEYLYLTGATVVLGEMQEQRATPPLAEILRDQSFDKTVRAYAARALGRINAEANQKVLVEAVSNAGNYYLIRTEAAASLAKIKDPALLNKLEQLSREEKDSHVKQKFGEAAQELRKQLQRPR